MPRPRARIGNSNGLCTPPRRPRPPQHSPPPAPLHPGRWRATPRAAPARRCGLQPGDTRGRTVWTGTACGGEIAKGILHAFQRGFYTLKGVRDTFAARTSPTSLRTTARLRQPNQTLLGEYGQGQAAAGRPRASDGGESSGSPQPGYGGDSPQRSLMASPENTRKYGTCAIFFSDS